MPPNQNPTHTPTTQNSGGTGSVARLGSSGNPTTNLSNRPLLNHFLLSSPESLFNQADQIVRKVADKQWRMGKANTERMIQILAALKTITMRQTEASSHTTLLQLQQTTLTSINEANGKLNHIMVYFKLTETEGEGERIGSENTSPDHPPSTSSTLQRAKF